MATEVLNQLNIDNLTSLWKKMGIQTQSEFVINGLHISRTWPHRYWFDGNVGAGQITAFNALLPSLPPTAIVPVWEGTGECVTQLENILKAGKFEILFTQLAMYLDLQSIQVVKKPALEFVDVQAATDIEIWTATASAAFGYTIDPAAIHALAGIPDVKLLLLEHAGKPAATALVYKTGTTIGVHLVGVPHEFRGLGLARTIMQQVIYLSQLMGGKFLTLQASMMGEPLYRDLGFIPQFTIKNYKKP